MLNLHGMLLSGMICLSVGIESVDSVGDTFKMSRFGHVSIDTETVSVSVSPSQYFCVEHNLGYIYEELWYKGSVQMVLLTLHHHYELE